MSKRANANRAATRDAMWLLDTSIVRTGSPDAAHAKRIIRAAKRFAKHWRAWCGERDTMVDADTIEAAWRLAELLGVEWKEPRHE